MHLQKLIANHSTFNAWANNKIVDWLQSVDQSLLYAQMPSSFTSIDYTLQHMLRVQKFWQAFVSENDTSNFDWSVFENMVDSILLELNTQSTEMANVFSAFSEEQLLQNLQLKMSWAKNELNRYEYIMHVINHSTFHRGQIVTMARNLGIGGNIPATDYNIYNCSK